MTPVILMYIKDCPWAKKLLSIYQEVSDEMPDRAFFTYVFSDNDSFVSFNFNGKNNNSTLLKAKSN